MVQRYTVEAKTQVYTDTYMIIQYSTILFIKTVSITSLDDN